MGVSMPHVTSLLAIRSICRIVQHGAQLKVPHVALLLTQMLHKHSCDIVDLATQSLLRLD